MLNDASMHKIDVVVTIDFARIARDVELSAAILRLFEMWGMRVFSVKETRNALTISGLAIARK